MSKLDDWFFESSMNKKNRILLISYILMLLGISATLFIILYQHSKVVWSSSNLRDWSIIGVILFLLWVISIKIKFYGGLRIGVGGAFVLTVLIFTGPFVALLCYTVGMIPYQFFRPERLRLRTKIISVLLNISNLGLALLISPIPPLLKVAEPLVFLWSLTRLLLVMGIMDIILISIYYAILDNKNPLRVALERLTSLQDMIPDLLAVTAFPGLAYMAAHFWESDFYLNSIFLAVPFLLSWKAMYNIPKIIEQMVNTMETLVLVIEAKDPYTERHCHRVSLYAMVIAWFCGLKDPDTLERLGLSARLHDVGKIIVPDRALKKDGKLTDEEYEQIKWHTDPHKKLMDEIPDDTPLKELIELGRHHHERYDGKGYPDHLQGEAIPLEVRITSMADAWDAMTSDRCYRDGLNPEKALAEIEKYKGKQWDPSVVDAFQDAYRQGALQEVKDNQNLAKNPKTSWKVSPKSLVHLKPEQAKTGKLLSFIKFYGKYKQAILAWILFWIFFLSYTIGVSPLHGNQLALFAGLAIFLELLEMKFTKYPRFTPVDAVLLAVLFILPIKEILGLILLTFFVRVLIDRKIEYSKVIELAYRMMLFPLSIEFFNIIGLDKNRLLTVERYFNNLDQAIYLFGIFGIWAFLYSASKFLIEHFFTMIRTNRAKISWYRPPLDYSFLFEFLIVVPISFVLIGSYILNPINFPYYLISLVILLIWTYPLLEYYRRVVEGNAKTLQALAQVADERLSVYGYQAGQSSRTALLSKEMASILGMSQEEIEILYLASRIFCLGKVGILDKILIKNGWLSDEEAGLVRKYVDKTTDIADQYPFYKEAVPVIRSQHECWNGGGYPDRLKGEKIPLGSRIIAVADAYYAMISERPYRKPLDHEEAVEQIKANSGTQFDPEVVEAFIKVILKNKHTSNRITKPVPAFSEA